MQQTNNAWVQQKKFEIEGIKRQLLEYNYAGSYGGAIDLMKVNNIIDGAVVEILKLQSENELLKQELNKANGRLSDLLKDDEEITDETDES